MSEAKSDLPEARELPEAGIRRQRWVVSFVWLVPLLAAIIAGWLVYKDVRRNGPRIIIQFADGKGLQAGQTVVRYRGVRIGEVESIELDQSARWVDVQVRLDQSAGALAREGAQFWIVRPDFTAGTLRGLDTIVGGPYIQIQPGNGAEQRQFVGLEHGPMIVSDDGGLDIILTWPRLGWMNVGAPVYYRGVEVGLVQDFHLGQFATNIIIRAHLRRQFVPLVRVNSKFWNAGGVQANIGFFGVTVSAESLKSLLVGGIAFATPSEPGALAPAGMVFPLEPKAEDQWLKWAPPIQLGDQNR